MGTSHSDISDLSEVIPEVINQQDLKHLVKPISQQEVEKVVFSFIQPPQDWISCNNSIPIYLSWVYHLRNMRSLAWMLNPPPYIGTSCLYSWNCF